MATGVLVLGVGRATQLLTFLVGCDKAYTATIRLGQSTVTDDAEGEVTASADVCRLPRRRPWAGRRRADRCHPAGAVRGQRDQGRRQAVLRAGAGGRGRRPGRASGDGAAGSPCCDSRGHGDRPDGTADVLDVDVEVEVSSGTYVRALARDLGAALGVGGHLTALRRTRVGRFGDRRRLRRWPTWRAGARATACRWCASADAARAQFARPRARRAEEATAARPRPAHPVAAAGRGRAGRRPSAPTVRSWPCSTSPARRPGPSSCSRRSGS